MKNLSQLQSQIESEAVKAFRERTAFEIDTFGDKTGWARIPTKEFEEWLTSTLHQATQRVAEETVKAIVIEDSVRAADAWLNHNSEEI